MPFYLRLNCRKRWVELHRVLLYLLPPLAASLVALPTADAQSPYLPGRDIGDVTINWSVLDELGPPPTIPGLVLRRPAFTTLALRPAARHHLAARSHTGRRIAHKPARHAPRLAAAAPKLTPPHPQQIVKLTPPHPEQVVKLTPPVAAEAPKLTPPVAAEVPKLTPPQAAAAPKLTRPVATAAPKLTPPPRGAADTLITREIAPAPAEESKAKGKAESKTAAALATPAPSAPQQTAARPAAPGETPKVPTAPTVAAAPPPIAPAPTPAPAPAAPPMAGGANGANGAASRSSASPPAQTAAANIAIPVAAPAAIPGRVSAVRFEASVSEIPASAQPMLDAVAARLLADDTTHLQLVAYASGIGDDPIEARRISLARAVAVRAYLIEKGVHSFRMDVRALGNRNEDGGPADRVDLILLDH